MKRAMSPLFSTIILIGFAIALGGVVMSWGKGNYPTERSSAGCGKASLTLIDYGEYKGICNKGNSIYFTIENNGEIDLDGIKISIIGENIYSTVVNKKINVADVVKLDLEYTAIGKIKKVVFVPRFIALGHDRLCPKNGFSIEDIGEC